MPCKQRRLASGVGCVGLGFEGLRTGGSVCGFEGVEVGSGIRGNAYLEGQGT